MGHDVCARVKSYSIYAGIWKQHHDQDYIVLENVSDHISEMLSGHDYMP